MQGEMGGQSSKPTTIGGNLELDVQANKMKKSGGVIRSSKELSRWAPGLMTMISQALLN